MTTLANLRQDIDAGEIAERTGHNITQGWWMKDLVFKEGEEYVWARFESEEPLPGVHGFSTFDELAKNDSTYHRDGVTRWILCARPRPSSGTGTRFFYHWLRVWCDEWRRQYA